MSGEMRRDEREASRKLQEAADGIRNNRLEEQIHYSGSLMRQTGQTSADLEKQIGGEIENLQKRLADAAGAVGQGDKDNRMANNLDRARNLVRGVDSMQQQMRDGQRGQQGQEGQQNQQGQQSERASKGSRGNKDSRASKEKKGSRGRGSPVNRARTDNRGRADNRDKAKPVVIRTETARSGMVRSAPVSAATATTGAAGDSASTLRGKFARSATRPGTGQAKPSGCGISCATTASTPPISTKFSARCGSSTTSACTKTRGSSNACRRRSPKG